MKARFVLGFLCLVACVAWGQKKDTAASRLKDTVVLHQVIISARPLQVKRLIDRTVVSVEGSMAAQGATSLDLLKKMPGVQVDEDGTISLNGQSGVMIYLDGRAGYLSANDLMQLLRGMSAEDISKIELMPHPSARYDAAGGAGLINIVRKRNRAAGWNGSLRINGGAGDYAILNGGGEIGYHKGPLNFLLTSGYDDDYSYRVEDFSTLDGAHGNIVRQAGVLNRLNRSHSQSNTLLVDWNLSPRSTLSFTGNGNGGWDRNVSTSYQDNWDTAGKAVAASGLTGVTRNRSGNYDLGMRFLHRLDTMGRELSVDLDAASYPGRPRTAYSNSSMMEEDRGVKIYVGQLDYSIPIPGKSRLELGVKSSFVRAVSDQRNYNDGAVAVGTNHVLTKELIHAGYINWVGGIALKLHVEAGLRAEQTVSSGKSIAEGAVLSSVERRYLQLFPSLFIEYALTDKETLALRSGARVVRPSYSLLNPQREQISAGSYSVGNPALLPQRNTHIEFGYTRNNGWWANIGVMLYEHWFRTFYFTDTDGITILRRPDATPFGWAPYMELGWSGRLLRWWNADLSAHLFERRFSGMVNGLQPVYRNRVIFSGDMHHEWTLGQNWGAEMRFHCVSFRQGITATYGSYTSLSCLVRRQVLNKRGSVSLGVNNLLNTEGYSYTEGLGYLQQKGFLHQNTRMVNLSANYRFGVSKRAARRRDRGDADESGRARE